MAQHYRTHHVATERTFMMVKPDGVMRGLSGEFIRRMEQRGLKVIGLKMVHATAERVDGFYPKDPAWIERLGNKGLKTFNEAGLDAVEHLGSDDPAVIGAQVRANLLTFMTMGPVVQMVVEGVQVISVVRKLVGSTLPADAAPGSIRGDFAHDAPTAANLENRSIFNLVHASETKEEAAHEVPYWFAPGELHEYDRADHVIMFGDKRAAL